MAQPLAGLGIWIWELAHCEHGDLDAICARAKACGVRWVAIKSGDSRPNGQMTRARVEQLRAGGLQVAAWWYSVPGTTGLQLAQLQELVERCGIEHFIQDAEIEWERGTDHRSEALFLADQIRKAIGDAYFADAPWPIIRAHPTFPFKEFGSIAQARMPQAYYAVASLDGGRPSAKYLDEGDHAWAAPPFDTAPVCPIVSPVNANGSKHTPLSELAAALDRYAGRQAVSIWSWQHLTAPEWALLEQRAQAANPLDVTDGGDNAPIFVAPAVDQADEKDQKT